jgi:hypothetical protein
MKRDERGLKNIGAEHRDAATLMSTHLDIAKVRAFPDRNSPVPVADQIDADKRAGAVMSHVHVMNQLNQLPPDVPEDVKIQADLAYLNALHRVGGDRAVEEELLRRKNYKLLMERNNLQAEVEDVPMAPLEPDAIAKSVVSYVDPDPSIAPEHQALRNKLKAASRMPPHEQRVEVSEALSYASTHGVANAADYIQIARLSLVAQGKTGPKVA